MCKNVYGRTCSTVSECYMLTVHGSHTLIHIPSHGTHTLIKILTMHQDSHTECYMLTVHGSHRLIQIPPHMKQITLKFRHFRQFVKEIFIWIFTFSGRSNKILHVNRVREPHVNPDSFTFDPVSQRKLSKFHLKIPACESQHILQSNLSQIHTYHCLKKPKRKEKNNLWEVCFFSAAVVSKLLLGWSGYFLFILCYCNQTAHSVTCVIHM